MTILVSGGRGKIARAVTAGLTDAGHHVRVASREPSAVPGAVRCDPSDPAPVLADITQVFLYSNKATAGAFVEAAEAAGVKQVVLLSSMSSLNPSDPHAETERIIGAGSYATTYLRPGAFMSNAIYWAHQVRTTGQIRLPYLEAEEAPIHEQDIADSAIRVLLDGPGNCHDGRGYLLTGPESMTRSRQIDLITEHTGIPIEPVDLTPEQARAEIGPLMRSPAQFESLMTYLASRVGSPHPVEAAVELLTTHTARPFTTWLKDNAEVFN